MKKEKGVIIAAYKPREKPRFAVLKRKKNWEGWELPKGHLEDGDYEGTVKMELEEEAGIEEQDIEDMKKLEGTLEWSFQRDGEEIQREYGLYLVEVSDDAHVSVIGNPHDEHESGFFFRYRDVKKMLTYDNQVEFLERAKEEIDQDG